MEPSALNFSDARYIKLGEGGAWCERAFAEGIVPFGYHDVDHALCAVGRWEEARSRLVERGMSASAATDRIRQVRDFYELPDTTLWVTIGAGHLWWTFAAQEVIPLPDLVEGQPSRYRRCRGGWSNKSLAGEPLTVRSLSSVLTQTANYRMTICTIKAVDYLARRIRGEAHPLHIQAGCLKSDIRTLAAAMIKELHWQEFETLVDLIFARGGWQRTSLLGKTMPDVDLILEQPITGETAWVQVKTGTTQSQYEDYLARFRADGSCDRFFFVCHSPSRTLKPATDQPHHHLLTGPALAELAVKVGLLDWLTDRTR